MSTTTDTPTASVFDISLESIAKAISHLSIEGLGEINQNTNLFAHWPSAEQWQSYQQKVAFTILHELPSAEKEAIETNLAAIDKDFNSYLERFVQLSTEENSQAQIPALTDHLYDLLKRCESLQKQIYEPTSPRHWTYPYFAHTLILHLAVLKVCTLYENNINESQLMQRLLNETTFYISEAERNAYQQRQAEIKQERGGARSELVYVQDSLSQESLTEWCDVSEKFKEIEALYGYLRAKVTLDYVQAVPFAHGYEIVEQLIDNCSDTKTGQDIIEEEKKTRKFQQQQWTDAVETTWKVAEFSADLLLKYAPHDPNQRGMNTEIQNLVIDTAVTLYTAAIGSLPIPGAGLIAEVHGIFLGWITDMDRPNPWKQLEDSLKQYTDLAILNLTLNELENKMTVLERGFDSFCKRRGANWRPGDTLNNELVTDLQILFRDVKIVKQSIYNPISGKHTTLPYFERCFTLYSAVLTSVAASLSSYTYPMIKDEYEIFYNDTHKYLNDAYLNAVSMRKDMVDSKSGGFLSHLSYVKDERTGRDLTDWWAFSGHSIDALLTRMYGLKFRIGYLYCRQLGLIRMFQVYNSLVKNYNKLTGSRVPEITAVPDSYGFGIGVQSTSSIVDVVNYYLQTWYQEQGYPSAGVRYGFSDRVDADMFDGPRFYEHSNFSGKSVQLTVGQYKNLEEIQGFSNDSLSSVKVPKGWKVTLYDEVNFRGASKVLTKSSELLNDFNDRTSSLIVEIDLTHEYNGLTI